MPTFKSTDEIKAYILSKSHTAVTLAAEKVYDIIKNVLDRYYSAYDPEYYIRTERLLRSLVHPEVVSNGNGWTARVYFDASALDYPQGRVPLKNGEWGWATWDGGQVLDAAMLGSSTRTWRNPIAIWDGVTPVLKSEVVDILKKELIAAGIPVR